MNGCCREEEKLSSAGPGVAANVDSPRSKQKVAVFTSGIIIKMTPLDPGPEIYTRLYAMFYSA